MTRPSLFLIGFSLIALTWLLISANTASAASPCTHYASPSGHGSGVSTSQAFKIANFWPSARAGYTLCLMDGQYTGPVSMINPPAGLRGTASTPITIRALNDGKATINGQSFNFPVRLRDNDHFVLEGFNAHQSKGSVVELSRSNQNIVRRVAAWDAADNNTEVFGAHHGKYNLFEDVAGWGVARKTFQFSQGGDYTTVRRAWGRWEGSHVTGPKMTYTLAYNNYNMTCENCIGTWSGERMKQAYTLQNYSSKPHIRSGSEVSLTDYSVDHAYGIFAVDGIRSDKDKHARAKLLGSIAYVRGSDQFAPRHVVFVHDMDSIELTDTVVYIEPNAHTLKKGFSLENLKGGAVNLIARNLTGIGGSGSSYGSDWKRNFIAEGPSRESVPNVFTSSRAANVCYRYQDGVRTTEPLWPWPMNQRIIDAMIASGREVVDVTKTIESMFGTIPPSCKVTAAAAAAPTLTPSAPGSP